jgi:hypothetical protein
MRAFRAGAVAALLPWDRVWTPTASATISTGMPVPIKVGALQLGATAKLVKGYYSHQRVFWTGAGVTQGAGVEMGGKDAIDKSGVGIDLGALYSHPSSDKIFYGVVIENLVQPNVKFSRQLPGGEANPIVDDVDVFKTAFNVGVGAKLTDKVLGAFDLIDVGNRAGRFQVAAGAEVMVTNWLGVRAGYNSKTSFTLGLSFAGLSINLAGRAPLSAVASFRF